MKVIVMLGAPGAGKGTIADGIKAAKGYVHVSTGDMLREAVKKGTTLGREAETFMMKGELVPDEIIARIVEERLDGASSEEVYVFDGFPRTIEQARMLERSLTRRGGQVDRVFYLDAPREVLIARLAGRRICRKCGANYHVVNIPPKKDGVCDACGGELYQRPDDREETIANRLEVYARQTEALIAHYQKEGVLVRIRAGGHRDQTMVDILAQLELAGSHDRNQRA